MLTIANLNVKIIITERQLCLIDIVLYYNKILINLSSDDFEEKREVRY